MKKLIAAAAALATAVNAAALSANAMFENVPESRIWDEEIEIFPMMESGEFVTDIDGNGTFDLKDCALFYGYANLFETEPAVAELIESSGDYDRNGEPDILDAQHLMRFYLIKNGIYARDIDQNTYSDINKTFEFKTDSITIAYDLANDFTRELQIQASYLMASYTMFKEAIDNGSLELDVNCDGVYDYLDLDYFWVFGYNHYFFYANSLPDSEKPAIPEDITARCQKAYDTVEDDMQICWFYNYAQMYCMEMNGLSDEHFDNDFYDGLIEGSGKLRLGDSLKYNYEEWMPQNEYLDSNGALFNRECNLFINKLKAGEAQLPDTNGDGIITSSDVFNAMIYEKDLQALSPAENSVLPGDVVKFFTEDCDINENGLSGDIRDLRILGIVYLCYASDNQLQDVYDDFNSKCNDYVASLSEANGEPLINYSPVSFTEPYAADADIERSGDANGDGNTDLSDAVRIMQALANPDKYQLSYVGRFNGDVSNTGDGITVGDAQEIQTRLLNLD